MTAERDRCKRAARSSVLRGRVARIWLAWLLFLGSFLMTGPAVRASEGAAGPSADSAPADVQLVATMEGVDGAVSPGGWAPVWVFANQYLAAGMTFRGVVRLIEDPVDSTHYGWFSLWWQCEAGAVNVGTMGGQWAPGQAPVDVYVTAPADRGVSCMLVLSSDARAVAQTVTVQLYSGITTPGGPAVPWPVATPTPTPTPMPSDAPLCFVPMPSGYQGPPAPTACPLPTPGAGLLTCVSAYAPFACWPGAGANAIVIPDGAAFTLSAVLAEAVDGSGDVHWVAGVHTSGTYVDGTSGWGNKGDAALLPTTQNSAAKPGDGVACIGGPPASDTNCGPGWPSRYANFTGGAITIGLEGGGGNVADVPIGLGLVNASVMVTDQAPSPSPVGECFYPLPNGYLGPPAPRVCGPGESPGTTSLGECFWRMPNGYLGPPAPRVCGPGELPGSLGGDSTLPGYTNCGAAGQPACLGSSGGGGWDASKSNNWPLSGSSCSGGKPGFTQYIAWRVRPLSMQNVLDVGAIAVWGGENINALAVSVDNSTRWVMNMLVDLVVPCPAHISAILTAATSGFTGPDGALGDMSGRAGSIGSAVTGGPAIPFSSFTVMGVHITLPLMEIANAAAPIRPYLVPVVVFGIALRLLAMIAATFRAPAPTGDNSGR